MARRKKTVVKSSPATGPGREAWFIVTALVLSILLFDSDARDPFLAIRMAALSAWGLAALTWLLSSRRPMAIAGRPGRLFLWLGLGYLLINLASLWKAQNVPEGLLAVARYGLHLALAYLLLILLSNPLQEMKLLSRFLTATLAACALIGIAQYYDVLPFDIPGTLPPTGLSGNRNLYGSFLVMLLPWAGFSFFQNKGLWRNLSIAALALGGFALVLSQTRSAWLATGILLATFQLLLLLRRHQLSEGLRRQWRYALLAGVMGIGAAIALAFASGSPLANSIKWRAKTFFQLPAQHAEPANEAERNAQDRLYVWKHTAEMIKAHPLLGIGAGNWRVRFPEYGGSSAPSFEGIDQMRLRPHNVYLGIASEAGLPALLLYLAMGALALGAAWRAGRRAKSESEALLAILLFSGLLAAAVDMAFSFPTERPEHNLLLLVYAALALNLAAGAGAAPKQARSTRIILAAGLVALLGFSFWMALQKRQLDRNMQEALRLETRGNFEMAARLSEQAEARFFSLDPIGDPVAWHTANAYKQMKQLDKALEKAETAERIQPNSHRVLNTKASILMGLERYEEAVPVLQKAVQLAPRYEPALTNLAYCLYRTGQNAACLETLEKLKLEENPRLLLVRSDAGYKMEMAKLENSPMYQVGLQFALEWKATGRAGISPAARALYEQRASDEAFIQEYFQTINTYCQAKAWQRGDTPEQVEALGLRAEQAGAALTAALPADMLARRILYNNHLQTVARLLNPPPGDSDNSGILFPMNE